MKELIVNVTPTRMAKMKQFGEMVPLKIKGGGHEMRSYMPNPAHHGGMISVTGGKFGMGTWKKIEKGTKTAAAVSAPVVSAYNPAAGAALGVYAASPNVAGEGKKSKKAKSTANTAAQLGAMLGYSSGALTPEQAQMLSATGNIIAGSGKRKPPRPKKSDEVRRAMEVLAGAGYLNSTMEITPNVPMLEVDPAPARKPNRGALRPAVGGGEKKTAPKPRFRLGPAVQ